MEAQSKRFSHMQAVQKPKVVRPPQGYTKAKKPMQAPVPEPEYYL